MFLDELPEFHRNALEVMRGPLEDRQITVSRVSCTLTYPCNFMLIASMNPCHCGYFGSEDKKCNGSSMQIANYMSKVSGPLLDRIDIHIEVLPVKFEKLGNQAPSESSAAIKERVNRARKIQEERYRAYQIYSNAELTSAMLAKFCAIDKKSKELLQKSFDTLGLSARAYVRILKVARTIADLEGSGNIEIEHISEAIQYRALDRKFH